MDSHTQHDIIKLQYLHLFYKYYYVQISFNTVRNKAGTDELKNIHDMYYFRSHYASLYIRCNIDKV